MTRPTLLLTFLLLAACGEPQDTALPAADRPLHGSAQAIARHMDPVPHDSLLTVSESFDQYFEAVGAVELSDSVLIDGVRSLDVSRDGRFLVQSYREAKVLLFEPDGSLVADLSAEECHPGHEWTITHVGFFEDGSILLTSGPHAPLLFDRDGNCTGAWGAPAFSDATRPASDGHAFQYFPLSDSTNLFLHAADGSVAASWDVEVRLPQMARRLGGGGLAVDGDGVAYLSQSTDARVRRFRRGVEAEWIGDVPEYFRRAEEDMPQVRGLPALMEAMRNLPPHTITSEFHLLDGDRLIQQFHSRFEWEGRPERIHAIRVMDTEGRTLNAEPIFVGPIRFAGARDGVVFREIPPVLDGGNSTLVLYRFTG